MKKITIKSKIDSREWSGTFTSEKLANEWIEKQIVKNSWGYADRWLLMDNPPVGYDQEREVKILEETFTEYHYPCQYTITMEDDYTAEASELYIGMRKDLFDDMYSKFGTRASDTLTAYYETWKLLLESPKDFINMITEDFEVLDTEGKVSAYAKEKISLIKEYAKFRMNRIAEFRIERAKLGE